MTHYKILAVVIRLAVLFLITLVWIAVARPAPAPLPKPKPTTKPIQKWEVYGRWQYQWNENGPVDHMMFSPYGTVSETWYGVLWSGRWSLDNDKLNIQDSLADGTGKSSWYVILKRDGRTLIGTRHNLKKISR